MMNEKTSAALACVAALIGDAIAEPDPEKSAQLARQAWDLHKLIGEKHDLDTKVGELETTAADVAAATMTARAAKAGA